MLVEEEVPRNPDLRVRLAQERLELAKRLFPRRQFAVGFA
jgi:hypothetical protein